MIQNKLGAIFIISVLALTGIGISYAGFSDTIFVYGTVDTATVELEIERYSGTWVFKIWGFEEEPEKIPPYFDNVVIYSLKSEIIIYRGFEENFNGHDNLISSVIGWANANNAEAELVASSYAMDGTPLEYN